MSDAPIPGPVAEPHPRDPSGVRLPHRVQRQRSRGWRMPPNTVYVGRPSRWANPYRIGTCLIPDAWAAVAAFAANLPLGNIRGIEELRGKNLACWCPIDQPCHADVLLELANR